MSPLRKVISIYRKGRKGENINCLDLCSLCFLSVLCGFSLFQSGDVETFDES